MSSFRKGFEFDFMAQRPMYRACPRWLIEHCGIRERSTVVDLGCGSGIVTQLLLEEFQQAPGFRVIAIDPSEWELGIARSRIADDRVTFIQGRAQEALSIVDVDVDAVLLCNVLHQVPLAERQSVLEGAYALVRPGGLVGANTLFYDGGVDPHTRPFYVRWIAETRESLARASIAWSPPSNAAVALQRLSALQHRDMFNSLGYEAIQIEEVQFDWTVEDWEALSRYSVFIHGALSPDIDLEAGSKALIEGVRATYRALGIDTVKRGWLHCVARRPRDGGDRGRRSSQVEIEEHTSIPGDR
jgi:ubiquinone/menaquinone biosynthesis C-methylase UbiE